MKSEFYNNQDRPPSNPNTLDKAWLNPNLPPDFNTPRLNLVRHLFDDIYALPMATSRRHEIWAGGQIEAGKRLTALRDDASQASAWQTLAQLFSLAYQSLYESWQGLEGLCEREGLSLPNAAVWGHEVINARKGFYGSASFPALNGEVRFMFGYGV